MRIQFVSSDRQDLEWSGPTLSIGSDGECGLQLPGRGVAPVHAELRLEADTLWLLVSRDAPRIYVNARPVRECAMVRAGDTLNLGEHRLLLSATANVSAASTSDAASEVLTAGVAAALRAVAGPCSGRVWPVHETLELDGSGRFPATGEIALSIHWANGRLQLDARSGSPHTPSVNGVPVEQGVLRNGDCIALGAHRFVVDAWGLEPDPDALPLRSPATDEPLPEDRAGPRGEVWWLILTAAVLALLMALFLVLHS